MATKTKKKATRPHKPHASRIRPRAGSKDPPNQTFIQGTEPFKLPALDAAVSRYSDLTRSRKSAKEHADEVLTGIVALMKENQLTAYRSNGQIVTVVEGQTVCKIKKASDK